MICANACRKVTQPRYASSVASSASHSRVSSARPFCRDAPNDFRFVKRLGWGDSNPELNWPRAARSVRARGGYEWRETRPSEQGSYCACFPPLSNIRRVLCHTTIETSPTLQDRNVPGYPMCERRIKSHAPRDTREGGRNFSRRVLPPSRRLRTKTT
jgi:hypothetical protein